jgi:Glycosyl transferases group 1/Glycosyl transferase 4-like domain
MSTVLILSFSDLARDPRVNRQIRFLTGLYDVLAAGFESPQIDGVRFIRLSPWITPPLVLTIRPKNFVLRKLQGVLRRASAYLHRTEEFIWSCVRTSEQRFWDHATHCAAFEQLAPLHADLIIANDLPMLPIACRLAESWNAKVLFDAHEYAPRENEELWHWRWFEAPMITRLCKDFIPHVDGMITVCPGIVDAYRELTGVQASVMTNAPEYHDMPVRPHVAGQPVQMVHHGGLSPSRKLENMIFMMDHLDQRFELTFVLVGHDPAYQSYLEQLAAKTGRVRFMPPVGMRELPRFLNQFDVGLYLLEPLNFNNLHSLPNKLFEFIQARLAVAIGASPEMASVVKRTGVGVVGEDFRPKTLAAHLNRLTSDDINRCKQRAHAAAWEMSAEANREILLDICRRLCPPKDVHKGYPRLVA